MTNNLFNRTVIHQPEEAVEFLASILEASTEYAMVGTDLDGNILLWNEGARRMYGYLAQDMAGQVNACLLHTPEDIQAGVPDANRAAARREGKWDGQLTRVRQNGQCLAVREVITLRQDERGCPIGFLMISHDISQGAGPTSGQPGVAPAQRQRVEDANLIGITVESISGEVCEANDYYLNMLGYTRAEFTARHLRWIDITPPDHLATDFRALDEIERTGVSGPYEKEYYRKDGTRVWVSMAAAQLPEEEGKIIAVIQDVSQRKLAEADREQQAEMLNLAEDAIIVSDLMGVISFWNTAAQSTYGWPPAQARGQILHVCLNTVFPDSRQARDDALRTHGRWEGELTHTHQDGRQIIVASRQLMVGGAGLLPRILEINRDITSSKAAQA